MACSIGTHLLLNNVIMKVMKHAHNVFKVHHYCLQFCAITILQAVDGLLGISAVPSVATIVSEQWVTF